MKFDKWEICDSLTKIEDSNEILSKFTKGRDKHDMILCNQITSYNKVGLGHQLYFNVKSFICMCMVEKKKNRIIYKCNYYHKSSTLNLTVLAKCVI